MGSTHAQSDVSAHASADVDADLNAEDVGALAWVARVVVVVRVAVVLAVGLLLVVGPPWVQRHVLAVGITLGVAVLYAIFLLRRPALEIRRTRYAWMITAADGLIVLVVIVFTGGPSSPCISILVLVVLVAAARSRALVAFGLAVSFAILYGVMVLTWTDHSAHELKPVVLATWWLVSLIFAAILATTLSVATEREQRSRLYALVQAETEHAVAEEERDLRARLLQSYQSQQDGLRVLLHEFRTPFVSLEALGQALADDTSPMSQSDRAVSVRLANDHIRHVNDMLDALGDVALSWRPTFSSGRVRRIDLEEVVLAAADAVGLRPPRLEYSISTDETVVYADVQALRRVLTNLLENASRHGRGKPITVGCVVVPRELQVSVMDRGPGVPEQSLGELTAKFVSLGDQRGTAGLGLWIVQQIVEATAGRLYFTARPGGGLVATFHLPLSPPRVSG